MRYTNRRPGKHSPPQWGHNKVAHLWSLTQPGYCPGCSVQAGDGAGTARTAHPDVALSLLCSQQLITLPTYKYLHIYISTHIYISHHFSRYLNIGGGVLACAATIINYRSPVRCVQVRADLNEKTRSIFSFFSFSAPGSISQLPGPLVHARLAAAARGN